MMTTIIHRADPRAPLNGIRAKNIADVVARLANEDDGAYLIDDGTVKVWVPKCLTTNNNNGTFTMPQWLAMKEGLI